MVNIFARQINGPLISLIKQVNKKLADNDDVKGFVVILTEDSDATKKELKKVAKDHGIEHLPLTLIEGAAGPKNYKIAKDAEVTVMMWRRQKVVANHTYGKGELNEKAIEKIASEIPSVF